MSKSIKPVSIAIAEEIERRIVMGVYTPGSPIRQADVANEFGVSHIPVREALASLSMKGLLELLPNRGATVTSMSSSQCVELAEMRIALESVALKNSIARLSQQDLEMASTALTKGEQSTSLQDRARWNWEFHRIICSKADRPMLHRHIQTLWQHADRYLRFTWEHANYEHKSDSEHMSILSAIKAGDVNNAVRANKRHIEEAAKTTVRILELKKS